MSKESEYKDGVQTGLKGSAASDFMDDMSRVVIDLRSDSEREGEEHGRELRRENESSGSEGSSGSESSGGGCYLSTACVASMNLPDNCPELQILRKFRDNVLLKSQKHRSLVTEYYAVAPKVVEKINSMENSKYIWNDIYRNLVIATTRLVSSGKTNKAITHYKQYVQKLISDLGAK